MAINNERCYLEPMVSGNNRVYLPDKKELTLPSSSLIGSSRVHLPCAPCTVSVTARYDISTVAVRVIGVPVVFIDRAPTDTAEAQGVVAGSVIEIHPGLLVYVVEFSDVQKECMNLPADPTLDPLSLKARMYRWEMFTGGQLFTCTSAGFDFKRTKVASFDLDGTLIKSKSGGRPTDHEDWEMCGDWVRPALQKLHENGYKLMIFTNQGAILKSQSSLSLHSFKMKIENVIGSLEIPIQVHIAAFFGGLYRKPVPGMWRMMEWNCQVKSDLKESFFVGDAAGRSGDRAASDRMFANNIGINFYTPEEFFLNLPPTTLIELKHKPFVFDPNTKMPDLKVPSEEQEVIIMVGPPSSGKTVFVDNYLIPQGYVPVSLDYFDDWELSLSVLNDILNRNKKAVVDHRNWQRSDRWRFIHLCKLRHLKVRCFLVSWTVECCLHNNVFKKMFDPNYESVSAKSLGHYKKIFEKPSVDEGFHSVLAIPFIPTFTCHEMKFFYNCYLHAQ